MIAGPLFGRFMKMKSVINKELAALEPGEVAQIVEMSGGPGSKQRLADLGFVPGTELRVIRVAPLGDPIEIEIISEKMKIHKLLF